TRAAERLGLEQQALHFDRRNLERDVTRTGGLHGGPAASASTVRALGAFCRPAARSETSEYKRKRGTHARGNTSKRGAVARRVLSCSRSETTDLARVVDHVGGQCERMRGGQGASAREPREAID